MFHKEGFQIIGITSLLVTILILVNHQFNPYEILQTVLDLIILGFFILILQFFRNPKRKTKTSTNGIVSPVDGKVVVIEEVMRQSISKKKTSSLNFYVTNKCSCQILHWWRGKVQ